jgi:hypothetical protein
MQDQVDAERSLRQRSDVADLLPQDIYRHADTGQDAHPPGLAYRRHQARCGDGLHWRLKDRVLDPEHFAQHRMEHGAFLWTSGTG